MNADSMPLIFIISNRFESFRRNELLTGREEYVHHSCMTLIDEIYTVLRKKILKAELSENEKLSENSLADEFGCSRVPVREALKRLERDGFVKIKPYSGSYVTEPTLKDFLEQTEVRAYLEALALRLACEKKIDTHSLEDILKKMDEIILQDEIDILSFSDLHYQFHRTTVDLSGNDLLSSIYSKMNFNTASQTFYQCAQERDEFKTMQEQHWKIVELIKTRNVKQGVEYIMEDHLWKKRELFRKQIDNGK